MNISSNNILIAVIYLLAGLYSLFTGLLALAKMDIKLPGFYWLGVFISNKVRGKDKTASFESDMLNRGKAIRYGIFWILIGLIALVGGLFLLVAG